MLGCRLHGQHHPEHERGEAAGCGRRRVGDRALAAPEHYPRIAMAVFAPLAALNLVLVNLRWEDWMAAFRQSPFAATSVELPLWAVNVLLVTVIGGVWLRLRSLERARAPQQQ